ncbi:MAG: hypothetical protein IJU39_01195, partial [Clostridia bacterium]|nr:hypothetical protein [Clostridia bacterium]
GRMISAPTISKYEAFGDSGQIISAHTYEQKKKNLRHTKKLFTNCKKCVIVFGAEFFSRKQE